MSKTPLHIELPPNPPPEKTVVTKDSAAIDKLPPRRNTVRPQPEMNLKVAVLIHEAVFGLFEINRFEDAFVLSEVICRGRPDYADAYYNASLALFHLGQFSEAKSFMQRGPASLWQKAETHQHMACVEVALGNLEVAVAFAEKAAAIDPTLLKEMLEDADLKSIWPKIGRTKERAERK